MKKKLINVQHIRFGGLTAVLLLSTVMLITIDESQNSVLAQNITSTVLPPHLPAQDSTSTPTSTLLPPHLPAQDSTSTPTTPALEPSVSDDESSSSDNSDTNNSNDDETSSLSGSDDDDNSNDSDSQQDTLSSEEEESEMEDDFEQTNPLLEQIRNYVNGALSASGIAVP